MYTLKICILYEQKLQFKKKGCLQTMREHDKQIGGHISVYYVDTINTYIHFVHQPSTLKPKKKKNKNVIAFVWKSKNESASAFDVFVVYIFHVLQTIYKM